MSEVHIFFPRATSDDPGPFIQKNVDYLYGPNTFPHERIVSDTVSRVAAHDRAGVLARVLAHYRACPDIVIRLPRVEAQNRATPRRLAPPVIFLAIA